MNTAGDQPATLYELYDDDGNFLKHGISQNPSTRYTQKELDGGVLIKPKSARARTYSKPSEIWLRQIPARLTRSRGQANGEDNDLK